MNRAGHSTKGGHTEQIREIGPAFLKKKKKQGPLREVEPRTYGSRGSSPVNIGSKNRGPFFFQDNRGKDGTLPYRDNGHSQRILHALGLFRASLSWREQNNRERPAQGSRASHTRVSRKTSVSVALVQPLSIFFV